MSLGQAASKPFDYHLSPQLFFDIYHAILSYKAFLQSYNSTNTTEYQASLFLTGFISLHRQTHLDEVIPLSQTTLDPLLANLEPPFTLTLTTQIIAKKLIFETAKQLKKFYEMTQDVIGQIQYYTLNYQSLFPTTYAPYTFSVPFFSNQPAMFFYIPCIADVALRLYNTNDEMVLNQIDRVLGGLVYPFSEVTHSFRLIKEYEIGQLPTGQTVYQRQRNYSLQFLKEGAKGELAQLKYANFGSMLVGYFDAEILVVRAVFQVEKTQRYVGCFYGTYARFNELLLESPDIFVFSGQVCVEGKCTNGSVQRLVLKVELIKETAILPDNIVSVNDTLRFQFAGILEQTTFLYTLRDLVNLLNKRSSLSIEVPSQFDANSCSCNCFPGIFVQPSPVVKIESWLSGYIKLCDEKTDLNEFEVARELSPQQILTHILRQNSKALGTPELSYENVAYAVPISSYIGVLSRELSAVNNTIYKYSDYGVFYAVFVNYWLLLYRNHADLLPARAYYLNESFAIVGNQLTRSYNSIAICTLHGCDILFKILPRIACNSNDFLEAYEDSYIGEMTIYKWVSLINEKCAAKVDNNLYEIFYLSHSLAKNANIKDLVSVVYQVEDQQLLFVSNCNIIDQISAFKSYTCNIYFMSEIFYLIYRQDEKLTKRKLRYDDIQDIKELKQNAVEIIVYDQSFAFKFKQYDRDQFLKVIVDLWQASQALAPTSLQQCTPSYPGIHNNEKSGHVLMREENGTWNYYYIALINKEIYFFKDPLDVQPQFHFPLTGTSCVNFDQQLQNQVASYTSSGCISFRFEEEKGQFQLRNYTYTQAQLATMLQTSDSYDIFNSIEADFYSIISGQVFSRRKLSVPRVVNFSAWTHSFANHLDIASCIYQLSLKVQQYMPKQANITPVQLEQAYIYNLSDPMQYSNQSAVNFSQFIAEFGKMAKASQTFGQYYQQMLTFPYYTDYLVVPLASTFAIIHHKKFLVLAAFSSNDRDDWISVINYYSPHNLPEVDSCLGDIAEVTNIDYNNQLQYQIQDFNIKLNDGVVLYSTGKFMLTRTTIFDIQKREFVILRNIKEYKITKFGSVKIININLKQIELDFGALENVKLFIDAVEIMRFNIIPSQFMHTTDYGLIDVNKLQACLDYIGAPKLDEDLTTYYTTGLKPDKYIFQSKPLEHQILRFISFLQSYQKLSGDIVDSSNFDELRQGTAVYLAYSMGYASRAGLNFNYLSFFIKGLEHSYLVYKYTRFVAPRPACAQYCFKIPSEFLKQPKNLSLVPAYIVCFAYQVLIFASKYSSAPIDVIPLKDCLAYSSDQLLSGFVTSRQDLYGEAADFALTQGRQAFDFGRAEQKGGTLGREAREMIRSVYQKNSPLNFFKNTAGLYFLNYQSHFFAFVSKDQAQRFISVVQLYVPEMSAASYDYLKQLAVSAYNYQFLLSVNTLFAEFHLEPDEILIRRSKFESLSPLEGEIPGGVVGTVDYCFYEKQLGDCYLTTHHVCIRFIRDVKNQKGLKITIETKNIIRISPSSNGITIVYSHYNIEGRVQINGMEDSLQFAKLAIDLYDHETGKIASSLLSNKPTAFAALYSCYKIISKTDCMLFYQNKFINVYLSLISVKDRMTTSGKPAQTSLQFYRQIGDSEPLDLFRMRNLVVDLNKQQFLQDVLKDAKDFENYLLVFYNRRGKVVYAILLFENVETCSFWAEIIRYQAGEIPAQKLEIIKQFSGTGKRLAIQYEVQETFSQHYLRFPDKQLFLSKYSAILSAKIAGCPVIYDFTQKMSDVASLKLYQKLISQQEDQINLFQVNMQAMTDYVYPYVQVYLYPPSLTSSPIGQLYLLSDCIGFASEKQIEILKYEHINFIATGISVFNFEAYTVQQTAQQFPELYKMPNTIIISCRRPAKVYSFQVGQSSVYQAEQEEIKYEGISDSEGDDNYEAEIQSEWEELTLYFILTPMIPQYDESLVSALASAALYKVKIDFFYAEKSLFQLSADKFDIGRRQYQATLNVLRIVYYLMDLCYEKRKIIPPSIFTNTPNLLALAHSEKVMQALILSNDLAQGWIKCFIFIKFDLMFVVQARYAYFTDQLYPFELNLVSDVKLSDKVYQITKIIDLRRASIMDGKFLTSSEGTVSIVGSKVNEFTIRLFQDDFMSYLNNPLYVTVPNGEEATDYHFVSNYYKLNYEYYIKFMNTKLQVLPHYNVRLDLDYLRPFGVLEDSITALAQKTQLLLSNLAYNQYKKQEIEFFEPDTLAILKLNSIAYQYELIQHVMAITQKYPASAHIKELTKKLSAASEQLEGSEDWSLLHLAEQPVAVFRCGLQTAKVSIPGKMMLGRVHLLFVGYVLGSKIYLLRRLSGFTAPPEFALNYMTLRGGLLDDSPVKFDYYFIPSKVADINESFQDEIARLVRLSRGAEVYISSISGLNFNSEPTVSFENVNSDLKYILLDLTYISLNITPASLLYSIPSTAACWPRLAFEPVYIFYSATQQFVRFYIAIFGQRGYIFYTAQSAQPVTSFPLLDATADRIFVDQELFEVESGKIIKCLKYDRGDEKPDELSDSDGYDRPDVINSLTMFYKTLVRDARQVLRLRVSSNQELDNFVDSYFVFEDSADSFSDSLEKPPAELYIAADQPGTMLKLKCAIELGYNAAYLFQTYLHDKEFKVIQNCERGNILMYFRAKDEIFKKCEIGICELTRIELTKGKKGGVIGCGVYFKKGKKVEILQHGYIVDCWIQYKGFSRRGQRICLVYKRLNNYVATRSVVLGCEMQLCKYFVKQVCSLIWWEQHNGSRK